MSWRARAGFDIVSVASDWSASQAAGGEPDKIVFLGVGKTRDDMRRALEVGVHCFNVESPNWSACSWWPPSWAGPPASRCGSTGRGRRHPPVHLHRPERNKFGIAIAGRGSVYARAAELANLRIVGVDCHIGSQLTSLPPFLDALERLLALVDRWPTRHRCISIWTSVAARRALSRRAAAAGRRLHRRRARKRLDGPRAGPGVRAGPLHRGQRRRAADPRGIPQHTAHKDFAIVDAAMNDLIRPALYQAWMDVTPVQPRDGQARLRSGRPDLRDRRLPGQGPRAGAGRRRPAGRVSAGAYGFVMSSNYNTRGRAAEVLVDGEQAFEVRRRETLAELYAGESLLPQ